ncbi:hypothetical protein SUGI_0920810 [Cryptomeria japonica]|uniref:gibberellin 3-beta-dioxygenase 1 n=1 Tax=Cryptomeria japonica TaxID=3369 RepID=UPI002414C176|nr:gibberellin 3-beta-dioxygenase 1 [Cryptomeria japonica]GLJ44147.1 hypothetical protein SUGI_0920810 [Cryptomeria japonica]
MPSLCDAFRSIPMRFKMEPDINLMKEVPELYVWPQEDQLGVEAQSYGDGDGDCGTPVIDLQGEFGCVVEQVRVACEKCAVFQIVNHGVEKELVDRLNKQSHRLFSLPLDQKMLARRSPDGTTGYGVVRIANFFTKLMWSEGFTWVGSPSHHAKLLWPHDYQGFCDAVEEYEKAMKKLARKLFSVILQSLGIKGRHYARWCEDEEGCAGALQMNHYPSSPCPSQTMGMAPHTDSALLTILYQGGVEGLQVKRSDGAWMLVPALPDAFVVNIGDLLQVISNGRYKSVVHRVVNNRRDRFSSAYIWGPPLNAVIEPAAEVVDSKHPRLYRSLTWHEYLVARAKHFSTALQLFTTTPVENLT